MKERITDALIIAYITVVSYMSAILYKAAYYSYFELPSNLVNVEPNFIFVFAIGIIGFLLIYFFAISGIFDMFQFLNSYLPPRTIKKYIIAFLPLSFIYYLSNLKQEYFIIILMLVIFSIIFDFVFPLIKYRNLKGFRNKLYAHEESKLTEQNSTDEDITLFGKLSRKYPEYSSAIFVTLIILITSYSYGNSVAAKQTKFLVYEENDSFYLIMDSMNDKIIVKEFDKVNNVMKPSFRISNWKENINYYEKEILGIKSVK